jgi:hypothetical protein
MACLLLLARIRQLYGIENLHPPGNPVIAFRLRIEIGETLCVIFHVLDLFITAL